MKIRLFFTFLLGLAFISCGPDTQGFKESFNASDTVSAKIFLKSGDQQKGNFRLIVLSSGVSSGFVKLNDADLMSPDDFKNDSFSKTLTVSLYETNDIEVEVRGKPGDQLCVQVYELNDDLSTRIIFDRCVDRTAGPPNNIDVEI